MSACHWMPLLQWEVSWTKSVQVVVHLPINPSRDCVKRETSFALIVSIVGILKITAFSSAASRATSTVKQGCQTQTKNSFKQEDSHDLDLTKFSSRIASSSAECMKRKSDDREERS